MGFFSREFWTRLYWSIYWGILREEEPPEPEPKTVIGGIQSFRPLDLHLPVVVGSGETRVRPPISVGAGELVFEAAGAITSPGQALNGQGSVGFGLLLRLPDNTALWDNYGAALRELDSDLADLFELELKR